MKAILVIDEMPKTCDECPLYVSECLCGWCVLDAYDIDACPLKPMPEKKNTDFHPNVVYANGWNDCLKEIKGD